MSEFVLHSQRALQGNGLRAFRQAETGERLSFIDRRTVSLGPYGHTAFSLPETWFSTAGRRGAIEFQTSGFGVAALGLRFNLSAFTSFNVLENINWR